MSKSFNNSMNCALKGKHSIDDCECASLHKSTCVLDDNNNNNKNDNDDDGDEQPSTPPTKRRRNDENIETLIDDGLYIKAASCLRLMDEKVDPVNMPALRSCLRRIVNEERKRREEFHRTTPATLDQLYDCIESDRDADSVELLQRGVRLDYSNRSHGVLLELCESRNMPRTVSYFINNHLLPVSLGLEYFIAALDARNAPLAFYLVNQRRVREALEMLDDTKRTLYRAKYSYIMFKYLTYNAIDCAIFQQSCHLLDLAEFSDDDFLLLMRRGDILTLFSDEQVIAMRNRVNFNPFGAASNLASLSEWIYNERLLNNSKAPDVEAVARLQLEFLQQLDALLFSMDSNAPGAAYLREIFRPRGLTNNTVRAA